LSILIFLNYHLILNFVCCYHPFFIYLKNIINSFKYTKINIKKNNYSMIGDWGLGIGDWGLGIGPNPQSPIPIPNPQSPIPIH
jgi:hypothetical protein